MLLVGWFDDSELEDLAHFFEEVTINDYIDEPIEYVLVDESKDGFAHRSHYLFRGKGNEAFSELSTEEKEKILTKMTDWIKQKHGEYGLTKCGFNYTCYFDGVSLSVDDNIYSLKFDSISDEPVFYVNNTKYDYPSKAVQAQTSSAVSKSTIYEYMALQYDIITNYGKNYIPEIHDPEVARMAASRFGITESEAGDIYVEKEIQRFNELKN